MDMLPRSWKQGVRPRGEVYSLLKGTQNVMAIVGRAVPWTLQFKNREKARERLYKSVCAPLTKGDSFESIGIEGHENESEVCCCFHIFQVIIV